MIRYIKGDATKLTGDKLLIHISNDQGGWGREKGFTAAINARWPEPDSPQSLPEYVYRKSSFCLGDVTYSPVMSEDGSNIWVANMVAQRGYKTYSNPVPLSYVHLGRCLDDVARFHKEMASLGFHLDVVCPKIGTGLGGGEWGMVEHRLSVHLPMDVTVYEL